MKFLTPLFIAALFALAACNTPQARINREPELFASLSPADQQSIREGKVSLGFTPEMVKLAVGEPDRIFTRTDANGTSESWSYTTYEGNDGAFLYRGFYHRDYCYGSSLYPYYMSPMYLNAGSRRERETFKVIFTAGRVSTVEQQTR